MGNAISNHKHEKIEQKYDTGNPGSTINTNQTQTYNQSYKNQYSQNYSNNQPNIRDNNMIPTTRSDPSSQFNLIPNYTSQVQQKPKYKGSKLFI